MNNPEPLADAGAILSHVYNYVRRFVSLSEQQARIATLWIVHTYAFCAAEATPYLAITSAEKQSGKTRLLEVLETLVANPWLTGRATAAVLTRKIDQDEPTLLLDESDAAFNGQKEYAEALRSVLNTGYRRGGKASCCAGQGAEVTCRDFSTFCPKAIAGIGTLPDTVADRAIPIRLKRAAPGEAIQRFRRRDVATEAESLRAQIEAWSGNAVEKLRDARPELPPELSDRQQDCAEPLLAIADASGGDWPRAARRALIAVCTEARASDDSIGKTLLEDIRQVFEDCGVDRMPSAALASALAEIETSPWSEWSRGKVLTQPGLAKLLKPFGIGPGGIRVGDKTPKGYYLNDFQDAFSRYLPPEDTPLSSNAGSPNETTQQASSDAASRDFSSRNSASDVAPPECEIASNDAPCGGVAACEPQQGFVTDSSGPGCTCRYCNTHFGTAAGWRAHIFRKRCNGG
jgi:hypothetical protein